MKKRIWDAKLYDDCHKAAFLFCMRKYGDREIAQEYAHKAVIKLYEEDLKNKEPIRNVNAWLRKVAWNDLATELTRDTIEYVDGETLTGIEDREEQELEFFKDGLEFRKFITSSLSGRDKEVAELYLKGYKANDVAEELGLKINSIYSINKRIKSKIRGARKDK